jgi:acetylcholinesterase
MESGSSNTLPLYNHTEREWAWQNFIKNIPSCAAGATSGKSFACLQNATEEELKTSYLEPKGPDFMKRGTWKPTLDEGPGSLVPDFPSRLYRQGRFVQMPLLSGTNLDEGATSPHDRNPRIRF